MFFHVPTHAEHSPQQEPALRGAQRWFHLMFDPTDDSDGPTPERFWKVARFRPPTCKKIEEILVNLSTGADPALRDETIRSIEAWKDAPFRPHVIARYRQQAYMYKTVMAYLDNLIAWGDSLFRQDTGEAIDEAHDALRAGRQHPRPASAARCPKKGTVRPQTYANLRERSRRVRQRHARFGSGRSVRPDAVPHRDGGRQRPAARRCAAWARRSTSAFRATTSC